MNAAPRPPFETVVHPRDRRASAAFTLIELLVVLAVVAVLVSMLLPAVARAKTTAQGAQCTGNARQLTFGWLMYADDHDGRLAPNHSGRSAGWVSGTLDFDNRNSDNTNAVLLTDPRYARLGPYALAASLFKCPSDRSQLSTKDGRHDRVRSMAMNLAVGGEPEDEAWRSYNSSWRTYQTIAQLNHPGPANLWVFLDEHPDSLDDGQFTVDLQSRGSSAYFYSWPANFHGNGANLSLADGHVERRRWVDERTRHENKYCGCLASYAHSRFFTVSPGNPDLAWLQERTSSPWR